MRLPVLWIHVVAAVIWVGGVAYQLHVLLPAARHGHAAAFADAARRARPVTWTAIALVVLSGFYNVTQLGSLERVMNSGAGLILAGKFALVIVAVALSSQRDFAQVTILRAALASGGDPAPSLRAIARLDRIVLLLALIVIYLGLSVSRATPPVVTQGAMPPVAAHGLSITGTFALSGTTWAIVEVDGRPTFGAPPEGERRPSLTFEREGGVSIWGCRQYATSLRSSGPELTFVPRGYRTVTACFGDHGEQDAGLEASLDATRAFRHEPDGLVLLDARGRVLLRARR